MLSLERVQLDHAMRFLESVARSTKLHIPWVSPPSTLDAFREFAEKQAGNRHISYLAVNKDSNLVGCINLNEIVRGPFQSAFLGFYVFAPLEGRGLMKQALKLVIAEAFTSHGLHRLEANVQPANERSKRLVQSLGFRHEGNSPRYLNIGGQSRPRALCNHRGRMGRIMGAFVSNNNPIS